MLIGFSGASFGSSLPYSVVLMCLEHNLCPPSPNSLGDSTTTTMPFHIAPIAVELPVRNFHERLADP